MPLTGGLGADYSDRGIAIVKYYKSPEVEMIVNCETFD